MTTSEHMSSLSANRTMETPSSNSASEEALSFRPFGITIALWSITVGSVGNLLTVLTYMTNKKLRTTFNLFLINLALIDLWTACGMLPFNLAGYIQLKWPFQESPFTARLQAFQYFCCGYSSVVFLVAITVNRFIGVMFPGSYNDMYTRKRTIFVLVFCNTLAPITLSPFLFGTDSGCVSPSNPTGALTGFSKHQFVCTFICLPPESSWNLYMQFTRVMFQFVPLVAMIVLYSVILTYVRRKRNAMSARLGIKNCSDPSEMEVLLLNLKKVLYSGNDVSITLVQFSSKRVFQVRRSSSTISNTIRSNSIVKKKSFQEERRQREDNRMVLISVIICTAFTVTFLPSVIVNLLPNRRQIDVRWHMAASNLTWFNSSINPIVYVFLNRRFRREYWRILQFILGSTKGKFIHDTRRAYNTSGRRTGSQSNTGINNSETETNKLSAVPDN